jgi:uncharacterized iron-regulated protein
MEVPGQRVDGRAFEPFPLWAAAVDWLMRVRGFSPHPLTGWSMRNHPRFFVLVLGALLLPARAATAQVAGADSVPNRVYDARTHRFTTFDAMVAEVAQADVAFFGEEHDDPATHRLEASLLHGLAARRGKIVVALEMFERDVQPNVDAYLAGRMDERAMLAVSRPWPKYAADYRPLVEAARTHHWPVIAGNVPRRIAAAVARSGLVTLDTLRGDARRLVAADVRCPRDAYFTRFGEEMRGHGGMSAGGDSAEAAAMTERFYQAQCSKDETMAESVAVAFTAGGPGTLVVHFNGAFHTDHRQGTAERTARRLPNARIVVISAVPVPDLAAADTAAVEGQADYVVFTQAPPAAVEPPKP